MDNIGYIAISSAHDRQFFSPRKITMLYVYVLLFMAVMVTLPEDSVQWWRLRRAWRGVKRWARSTWSDLKDKAKGAVVDHLKNKLADMLRGRRELSHNEEFTDEKMIEVLATRNVHDLFKEGELNNDERAALSVMQEYARALANDEFVDVDQPVQ